MTTMLEKAARALYARRTAEPWDDATARMDRLRCARLSINQEQAMNDARAALQAIRDLDSGDINDGGLAALVAGKRALYSCSADPELQDARGCFHAMIDAMLNDAHAKPAVGVCPLWTCRTMSDLDEGLSKRAYAASLGRPHENPTGPELYWYWGDGVAAHHARPQPCLYHPRRPDGGEDRPRCDRVVISQLPAADTDAGFRAGRDRRRRERDFGIGADQGRAPDYRIGDREVLQGDCFGYRWSIGAAPVAAPRGNPRGAKQAPHIGTVGSLLEWRSLRQSWRSKRTPPSPGEWCLRPHEWTPRRIGQQFQAADTERQHVKASMMSLVGRLAQPQNRHRRLLGSPE